MADQEKIIRLAEIDVLEMLDVLKTCDRYLDKIPDGLLAEKYDLKFRVNHLFTVLDSEVKINNE
jgi:hypothetical protein